MPALYSLGQHSALSQVHNQLHLYAFLDDIYAVVPSARVRPVLDLLSHHLPTDASTRAKPVYGTLQAPSHQTQAPSAKHGSGTKHYPQHNKGSGY